MLYVGVGHTDCMVWHADRIVTGMAAKVDLIQKIRPLAASYHGVMLLVDFVQKLEARPAPQRPSPGVASSHPACDSVVTSTAQEPGAPVHPRYSVYSFSTVL